MQIAFSGKLGSGKSTVCAILREKYGYEIYSTGTVQRKVAEEMGIDTLELNKRMKEDPKLDHIIDDAVVKLSRERAGDKIVYDSRMAWHFAENTFKVYMYVDPSVAGKRVFTADRGNVEAYKSVEEAKEKLIARSKEENQRFKDIYGVDNFDYNNYDLIIDSTSATPEQIAEMIVYQADEYEKKAFEYTKVILSPYVIFPTKPFGTDDGETIEIAVKDGYHFALSGHNKLTLLQQGMANFIETRLGNRDPVYNKEIVAQYESAGSFQYQSKL